MIYLLHGENVGASRQALLGLKENYSADSVSVFDSKNFDEDEFVRACETPSLLSDRRLIIVEGKLPVTNYPARLATRSVAGRQLPVTSATADIVFWLGEELKPSNKLFKLVKKAGGQITHFKPAIPKHVFGFLDALGYRNKKKSFLELHRLLDQGEAPLYLLKMMVWAARNWLNVKFQTPVVKKMHPFVQRKTKSQAKNFEEEELVGIFRRLLEAEVTLKTTQLASVLVLDRVVDGIANPKS